MLYKSKPSLRILTASAGSGKTFALTIHYLGLIIRYPTSYRSILALTFTNKATAEMKGRILRVLKELANGNIKGEISNFLKQLQEESPEWTEELIVTRSKEAYRQLLHDYSHFYIQTIDGFSQQVIRSFTYELGLDSGYRIEMNDKKVKKDLSQRLYESLNANANLKNWILDHMVEQLELGKDWNVNRKLLDLAGMIFTESFKDFDDWISQEHNSLLVDAAWKAAKVYEQSFEEESLKRFAEMQSHFSRLAIHNDQFFYPIRNPLVKIPSVTGENCDFEYFLARIPKVLDDIEEYQREKKRSREIDELYAVLNPLLNDWKRFMDAQYRDYVLAKALTSNLRFLRVLKDMSDLLGEWRTDEQAQLISDAQKLLEKIGQTPGGDPTFIWEKMGNRFRYFLFDEFQDTSKAQWSNLFPLVLNSMGEGNRPYFQHLIVGDVKQSIYRWRNGDFRILLQGIEQDVARSLHVRDTSELIHKSSLEYNFRSQRTIIEFNNSLFAVLPKIVQRFVNDDLETNSRKIEIEDFWKANNFDDLIIRAYEGHLQKIPISKLEVDTGRVQIFGIDTKKSNAGKDTEEKLSFKTLAFHKAYSVLKDWMLNNDILPGDIGILTRTGAESREIVAFIREQQQIDQLSFDINSGDAFLLNSHPAVLTLISTLRSLAYPDQKHRIYLAEALFHYYQYRKKSIPEEAWLAVGRQPVQQLDQWFPSEIVQSWEVLGLLPLGTLVEKLIQDYSFGRDAEITGFLMAFRDFVEKYNQFGYAGLQRFVTYWDEEGQELTLPGDHQSNAVQVMTIHKSKGLDFKAVLVPLANWNLTPKPTGNIWVDLDQTAFAALGKAPLPINEIRNSSVFNQVCEENLYSALDGLNNLYVATTRAVQELCMIFDHTSVGKDASKMKIGSVLEAALQSLEPQEDPDGSFFAALGADHGKGARKEYFPVHEFKLDHYPGADILANLVRKSTVEEANTGPNLEARRFGNLLHELMAEMISIDSLEGCLDRFERAGKLPGEKRNWIRALVLQAWGNSELGPLLSGGFPQANEMAMVDLQGKTFRPDKIIFTDNETIVIDFKLAGQTENPLYVQQLEKYLGFLRAMGYRDVRGYIYYFVQDELQAV